MKSILPLLENILLTHPVRPPHDHFPSSISIHLKPDVVAVGACCCQGYGRTGRAAGQAAASRQRQALGGERGGPRHHGPSLINLQLPAINITNIPATIPAYGPWHTVWRANTPANMLPNHTFSPFPSSFRFCSVWSYSLCSPGGEEMPDGSMYWVDFYPLSLWLPNRVSNDLGCD